MRAAIIIAAILIAKAINPESIEGHDFALFVIICFLLLLDLYEVTKRKE